MAKNKIISDEAICLALLGQGSIKKAAEVLEISANTISKKLNDNDFEAVYLAVKADLLREGVTHINNKLIEAIDAVSDLMNNEEVNPAVRLQAAQTILNNVSKFSERLTEAEKAAKGKVMSIESDKRLKEQFGENFPF